MDDLDLDKNQDFFMKLRAWNPGEEENDLTNYAYFHYNVDSDNDGLPDYLENRIFNGLEYDDKDDFDNDGFWNIEEFSENTLLNFNENYPFCFLERHCPLSKPFCYDYQCKMCIDDFDCFSIDKPYCFDGVCHECTEETEDIDCAKYEDKSRCPSYLCVECNEETEVLDCGGGQCVGHTCFECTEETEATDCAGGVCLGNVCVECNSHDQCGVNEYCWLDNTCQTKSCTDVSQCEDYDDCSEDECVEGFCKFTKFTDEKYCYYCAGLDYCSQKGGMNICGGTDLDHSGFVEYSDVSIFSNLCVLDIPCDENNNFCDYADINRDGYPYCGEVNKIVEYYNLECRTL